MYADHVFTPRLLASRKQLAAILSLCVSLALPLTPAMAHSDGLSEASALSALPLALSVTAPSVLVAGVSALTIVSITVVADGTVWVLQRASDGARVVVKLSAATAGAASVVVGSAVTITAVSAGWVLSAAGEVLAIIPNALGQALLYHERVIK